MNQIFVLVPSMWDTRMELPTPSFGPAQSWLLWHLRHVPVDEILAWYTAMAAHHLSIYRLAAYGFRVKFRKSLLKPASRSMSPEFGLAAYCTKIGKSIPPCFHLVVQFQIFTILSCFYCCSCWGNLSSSLYMWVSSFLSTISWRDYLFPIVCFGQLYQK